MNSNITLSSFWFCYLFDNVQLRLGGHIKTNNPAIVINIFYNLKNNEFKYQNGEYVAFIPDTSSEISNTIETKHGNVVGADAAAVIASVKNANQRNIQTNKNYNNRFV